MIDLSYIIADIKFELETFLQNSGIYYRIFARQKSSFSISRKLEKKGKEYRNKKKKMQDIIGVRIVLYFMDDVDILNDFLHQQPRFLDDSTSLEDLRKAQMLDHQIENLSEKMFMPTRLNLIFRMENKHGEMLQRQLELDKNIDSSLIDDTYEIQIRTVLSEGWHEVEHDLRYKSKDEQWWSECEDESRMLNGIYATLETSERALQQIFSSIAYKNYKSKEWSAMMKNHLRIHTQDVCLSPSILNVLNGDVELAKAIFRVPRNKILDFLLNLKKPFPLKMDNLLFLVNRLSCNNKTIIELESEPIKIILSKLFKR